MDFTAEILAACKNHGLNTALDTCGYGEWAVYEKVLHLVDFILFDIKAVDEKRHIEFTGVSNLTIKENLRRLLRMGKRLILRLPVIPPLNNDDNDLFSLMGLLRDSDKELIEIELLPYNVLTRSKYNKYGATLTINPEPCGIDLLRTKAAWFKENGINVRILGVGRDGNRVDA